ncbi:MAG: hypothetical protein ABF811_09380 [Pseudoclavibacter sp.]
MIFKSGADNLASMITATGAPTSDIRISEIGAVGAAVDDVTLPRWSRTYNGLGMQRAISFTGDTAADPTVPITNVTISNIFVQGCSNLPELYLNFNVGFIYCDNVIFTGNTVGKSCDNGVSMSRDNTAVTCVGNAFENCAYWSIRVSGLNNENGLSHLVVLSTNISTAGYVGINAETAPQYGVLIGNHIYQAFHGDTDTPDSNQGIDIQIAGTGTLKAANWNVLGNLITDVARGGVLIKQVIDVLVTGNAIYRAGHPKYASGSLKGDTAYIQDFEVAIDCTNSTTVANIRIMGNHIVDDRPTPAMISAVNFGQTPQASMIVVGNIATRDLTVYNCIPQPIPTFNTAVIPSAAEHHEGDMTWDRQWKISLCADPSVVGSEVWRNADGTAVWPPGMTHPAGHWACRSRSGPWWSRSVMTTRRWGIMRILCGSRSVRRGKLHSKHTRWRLAPNGLSQPSTNNELLCRASYRHYGCLGQSHLLEHHRLNENTPVVIGEFVLMIHRHSGAKYDHCYL